MVDGAVDSLVLGLVEAASGIGLMVVWLGGLGLVGLLVWDWLLVGLAGSMCVGGVWVRLMETCFHPFAGG